MISSEERNKNILRKYIPNEAVDIISGWIYQFDFKLKVRKERSSKNGDYRPPFEKNNHQITINRNLNKYAFLITLIHEIAHLTAWNKYKNTIKPHGTEWKAEFRKLAEPFIQKNIFPHDLLQPLQNYLKNPAASSCTDADLYKALKKFNTPSTLVLLDDVPLKTNFAYKNKGEFIKLQRLRTRFKCIQLATKKEYLFNPLAEVELINQNQ